MLATERRYYGADPGGQYHRDRAVVIPNPNSKGKPAHRAWQFHIAKHDMDSCSCRQKRDCLIRSASFNDSVADIPEMVRERNAATSIVNDCCNSLSIPSAGSPIALSPATRPRQRFWANIVPTAPVYFGRRLL
jgi:hypothetical protein